MTSAAGTIASSYYQGGLASVLTNGDYTTVSSSAASIRASEVAWLADNFLDSTAATFSGGASGSTSLLTNLVALQLDQWDIIQDGGDGLSAGTLRVNGADLTTYGTIVTYWETQAASHTTYVSQADFIQAPTAIVGTHSQYFTAVLPEPSSFVMMAGMNIPGLLLISRKRRSGK